MSVVILSFVKVLAIASPALILWALALYCIGEAK